MYKQTEIQYDKYKPVSFSMYYTFYFTLVNTGTIGESETSLFLQG